MNDPKLFAVFFSLNLLLAVCGFVQRVLCVLGCASVFISLKDLLYSSYLRNRCSSITKIFSPCY